ncbi:vWA domain-containing protein [Idiomarina xiamenensis]|uniref:von Willebrand factor A n=1 Tax=Idiomarina xiamenensis 10-D-4 TaxID=740709 RepID=K2KB60_9GAMM|nr:VWA domain-containing protein [Idiomarina xiamenensis]EKE83807.1 von Willebrand factor A [Idiomarina xiamenensis 10-D-4]
MISLQWPWLLLLLPLPWLLRWLLPPRQVRRDALRMPTLLADAQTSEQPLQRRWPLWLATLIWLLLVLAAARPERLGEPLPVRSDAREMMLAVDLSGSMEIADMTWQGNRVDRLTMVKHVLGDFILRREGDRLGLILFGDTAFLQTPMTYDRETVQQMLDDSVIGLVGQRTAIGDAVALAIKRFRDKGDTNRVVILLTDGQNTAGNIMPQQALELAQAFDVKIYAIGVGADEMVVENFFGRRRVNPSSDLDEKLLSTLAESTGGQFFRARNTAELEQIYQRLDELEPVAGDKQPLRPRTALFYWPLAAALVLSVLYALLICGISIGHHYRQKKGQQRANEDKQHG